MHLENLIVNDAAPIQGTWLMMCWQTMALQLKENVYDLTRLWLMVGGGGESVGLTFFFRGHGEDIGF